MRYHIASIVVLVTALTTPFSTTARETVRTSLIAETAQVNPGKAFTVAIRFQMEPGWHVYWRNPGDSGLAPTIKWDLPKSFAVSPIQWPCPKLFGEEPVLGFGYEKQVLLLADLTPPAELAIGQTVSIGAAIEWLACEELCLPGNAELRIELPVQSDAAGDSAHAPLIASYRLRVPRPARAWQWQAERRDNGVRLLAKPPAGFNVGLLRNARFLPGAPWAAANALRTWHPVDGGFALDIESAEFADETPSRVSGVLVFPSAGSSKVVRTIAVDAAIAAPETGPLKGNE